MVPWVRVCRNAEPGRQWALGGREYGWEGRCATMSFEVLVLRVRGCRVDFSFDMHLHFSVSILLALLALTTKFGAHEAKHSGRTNVGYKSRSTEWVVTECAWR